MSENWYDIARVCLNGHVINSQSVYRPEHNKKYCEKCHEKGGSSSADDAGILAGQQKTYLKKSLDEIIKGDRDVGKKMIKRIKKVQQKYGDDGFDQLIQYYISQGGTK